MRIVRRLLGLRREERAVSSWITDLRSARLETHAGVTVSETTALTYSAVFAAVRVLAESVASLPWILYARDGEGRRRATDHPLYEVIHTRPNDRMTAMELYEVMMTHLCLWGNAYCEIERTRGGRVVALWPLIPSRVTVRSEWMDGVEVLMYDYVMPSGGTVTLPQWDVLHVRGLGTDGYRGLSPIGLMRQTIGLGLAAQEFGSRFFSNGARPSVLLEHPGHLSDGAVARLRRQFEESYSGLERAHRVAILEEGMRPHTIGIPPDDAQFLETRRFQVEEIARIYRVPPHMLGDLERATFSNIEHQSISFVTHSLRPWLVRIEQAMSRALLSEAERRTHYIEALVDGLLRGDVESRYRAYSVGRQWGWLSANDVRRLENMDPVPSGDAYLVPLNMVPAGSSDLLRSASLPEEQRGASPAEARAARPAGAEARHRLRQAHLPLLEDALRRVTNREVNDLRGVLRRLPALSEETVGEAVAAYIDEYAPVMRRLLMPVYLAYGTLVRDAALAEVEGATRSMDDEALQRWMMAYLGTRTRTWLSAHRDRLLEALREAGTDDPEALREVLEAELDAIRESEPSTNAQVEATRVSGGIARTAWEAAGVVALRWVAFGDTCPYCRALNGKRIGITDHFLPAGADYQPEGADAPLTLHVPVGHPPAHVGCDCMIVPAL